MADENKTDRASGEMLGRGSGSGRSAAADRCNRYYEKAIEGRNFHYANYNAWVNLYAIFTGALFAGFCALYDKCGFVMQFIVCALGFICAVCWHYSVKGYYHWMLSWIKIVHDYETEMNEVSGGKAYYVYSVHAMDNGGNSFQCNISTQKVTAAFTAAVIAAWVVLLAYCVWECAQSFCCGMEEIAKYVTGGFIGVIMAASIIYACRICKLHSDTQTMKKDIFGNK